MRHPSAALAMALGLFAATQALGQEPTALKGRLDAIVREQTASRERYHQSLTGKPTEADRKAAVDRYVAEVARGSNEILELVRATPRDPAVVEALGFVIRIARGGPGNQSYRAMEILLREHPRDRGIGPVCSNIAYLAHSPIAESLLRAVLLLNPGRVDKAEACYALAGFLTAQARMVRRVRESPSNVDDYVSPRFREEAQRYLAGLDPAMLDRESELLLERVQTEFADVKNGTDPRPLGVIAEGELFARRNLAIGMVAPEIRGQDHEGRWFSLADERGKVTVLTFSGNWCGPCVAMYPEERDLVARLKDRPFALVSVNTDAKVEALSRSIASGEVTWRCWWDGGTDGPITTRWGISGFPTLFVLDKAGVIRFKDVRGEELKKAVDKLLAD